MSEDDLDGKSRIKLRHTSIKRKKVCPRCLSDLEVASPFGGWLIPQEYKCKTCGYYGTVALEFTEREKA
ncbi:MAG: hypothetical protein ACUVWK_06585 [Nitrososphaerales archaeon]